MLENVKTLLASGETADNERVRSKFSQISEDLRYSLAVLAKNKIELSSSSDIEVDSHKSLFDGASESATDDHVPQKGTTSFLKRKKDVAKEGQIVDWWNQRKVEIDSKTSDLQLNKSKLKFWQLTDRWYYDGQLQELENQKTQLGNYVVAVTEKAHAIAPIIKTYGGGSLEAAKAYYEYDIKAANDRKNHDLAGQLETALKALENGTTEALMIETLYGGSLRPLAKS